MAVAVPVEVGLEGGGGGGGGGVVVVGGRK